MIDGRQTPTRRADLCCKAGWSTREGNVRRETQKASVRFFPFQMAVRMPWYVQIWHTYVIMVDLQS
eukprot:903001-Rhodomonas_salina.2